MHFKTIFKSLKNKDMLRRVGIIFGILIVTFLEKEKIPELPLTFQVTLSLWVLQEYGKDM